jgi:hypothetical protein
MENCSGSASWRERHHCSCKPAARLFFRLSKAAPPQSYEEGSDFGYRSPACCFCWLGRGNGEKTVCQLYAGLGGKFMKAAGAACRSVRFPVPYELGWCWTWTKPWRRSHTGLRGSCRHPVSPQGEDLVGSGLGAYRRVQHRLSAEVPLPSLCISRTSSASTYCNHSSLQCGAFKLLLWRDSSLTGARLRKPHT